MRRCNDDDNAASSAVEQWFISAARLPGCRAPGLRGSGNVSYLTGPTVECDGGADMQAAILPFCHTAKSLATSATQKSEADLGG